jgi:phospholipid transport system substrate-binding protein
MLAMNSKFEHFEMRWMRVLAALGLCWGLAFSPIAQSADLAPDEFIKNLCTSLLDSVKTDKSLKNGDPERIRQVVDTQVLPNLNFQRMTASAVGPQWRSASDEQKAKLQEQFKILLMHTYAGALTQIRDQTVSVKPLRADPQDKEVLVKTEIKGSGEPIQLDYRLEKTPGVGMGWKIYNLNVLGVWLVDTYRTQFSQEINAKGIEGLIATLSERNQSNASAPSAKK